MAFLWEQRGILVLNMVRARLDTMRTYLILANKRVQISSRNV